MRRKVLTLPVLTLVVVPRTALAQRAREVPVEGLVVAGGQVWVVRGVRLTGQRVVLAWEYH